MKRAFIYLGVSVLFAFLLGFFPTIGINREGMDILFTVSGIIFSVGMSLVITSNTQNIRKPSIRKKLHQRRTDIAVGYVWNFALLSLLYVLLISIPLFSNLTVVSILGWVSFSPSMAFLSMALLVNLYFVLNFLQTMRLNNEIEDYAISGKS